MSTFVFANNVNTTLAAGINSTATTITLTSSAHLPTLVAGEIFALTLNDAATQSVYEIVYVTAITGATLTVIRGQENTAAQSWLTNDYAYASNTAGILGSFIQSGSEPGNGFVALSPPTQQTGNIDVSGTLNLGLGDATAPGDGGFGRSASSGAIVIGGASSNVVIDYNITNANALTTSRQIISQQSIQSTPIGNSVPGPLSPGYDILGHPVGGTAKKVQGFFQTASYNPTQNEQITLLGQATISLSPDVTFSNIQTYSVFASWYNQTSTGAVPTPISIICYAVSTSSFTIQVFGASGIATDVVIYGTFTAIGY